MRLYNPDGNASTTGGILQVCTSETWKAVCYYTFDCINEGRAACRQLGYGGANLSENTVIDFINVHIHVTYRSSFDDKHNSLWIMGSLKSQLSLL